MFTVNLRWHPFRRRRVMWQSHQTQGSTDEETAICTDIFWKAKQTGTVIVDTFFRAGLLFVLPWHKPEGLLRSDVRTDFLGWVTEWRNTLAHNKKALLTVVMITVRNLFLRGLKWVGYLTQAQIWMCEYALFFPSFYSTDENLKSHWRYM